MATDMATSVAGLPAASGEGLIDARIRTTRRQVKTTELAVVLLSLAVGALAYLLVFVLVDHWIIPGGVGPVLRFIFFVGFIAGLVGYLGLVVWPLMARRVNPLYAAHAIEEGRPTLKNSIVNFLMLRGERQHMGPAVYRALEHRAATDLSGVPLEGAIDRSRLIRLGYILLGAVAICCLYTMLSPKNPLRSVGRLIAPWSDLRAATRVTIDDVQPGAIQRFHGDSVDVSAVVQGLRSGEPVTVLYSTADGRSVDQPVAMERAEGGLRHLAALPGGGAGLQQSLTYRIQAGDAHAGPFTIEVLTALSILVDEVEYDYPDYTGLATRRVERQGDLVAIEGTVVKLRAGANREIATAHVDFDCDGHRDREMQVGESSATATWTLELNKDRSGPAHDNYQLRFVTPAGQENPRPIRHSIQVTADQPPTVELLSPTQEVIEVPVNGEVTLEVAARDSDFALAGVWLHAERDGQSLIREALLAGKTQPEFRGKYTLKPEALGLRTGDEATFWAVASDNKQPTANQAQTSKYRLRVTEPADPNEQPPVGNEGDQQGATKKDGAAEQKDRATDDQRKPGESEPAAEEPQADEPRKDEEPQQRIDPETEPGDAFNEILKHAEKEKKQEPAPQQPEDPANAGENQEPQGEQPPQDQPNDEEQQKKDKNDSPQDNPSGSQGEQGEGEGQKQKQSGEGENQSRDEQQGGGQSGQGQQGQQQQKKDQGGQGQGEGSSGAAPSQGGGDKQNPAGGEQQDQGGGENAPNHGDDQLGNPSAGQDKNRTGGDKPGGASGNHAQPRPGEQGGEQSNDATQGEQQPSDGATGPAERKQGEAGESGASRTEKPRADDKIGQEGDPSKRPGDDAEEEPTAGDESGENGQPGQGGASAGRGDQRKQQGQPDKEAEQPEDTTGGDPQNQHGNSGAGQSSEQQKPTGEQQERGKPKNKKPGGEEGGEQKPPGEASSPSTSPHESDSQGGEEGDRSGGGKQGAGQSSNQPGTGGAGQNTASDEGASQAPGAGGGETSDQAGDKKPGGSASNNNGPKQRGQGADGASQPSDSGQQGGQPSGGSPSGESGPQSPQQSGPGSQSGPGTPGNSSGQQGESQQQGEGERGRGPGGQDGDERGGSNADQQPPTEDAVNMDYANQATDLALQHLRDQLAKDEPDQELLDKLQWTREEMEQFLKRWEELKRQAQAEGTQGDDARRELDEALRGLGLRPRSTQIEGRRTPGDRLRELRDSRRTAPPAEYAEQYRAYTEGTSKRKPGE